MFLVFQNEETGNNSRVLAKKGTLYCLEEELKIKDKSKNVIFETFNGT